ncbi:hypothetical protein DLAC_11807 [Tieghemostelium lacteum]|uniref:CCD97-like C-terminal domain-containing protein n=1 Tax=Tieghemostelium lacteum TaxID=361077 RepID=A0A151Z5F1_TIELA|nr:hypothetical protein DLAC_11807 [Tieghemostelium lacteum]|eukprot:KYQ89137.1 hypothetical protein DLAC_11807 [Tieghemostelium lacteum]
MSKESLTTIIKNKRYHYYETKLKNTDYFSIEKCRERHPFLYHQYIGSNLKEKENRFPNEFSAEEDHLSARLLEKSDYKYRETTRIQKELVEIENYRKQTQISISNLSLDQDENDYNDNEELELLKLSLEDLSKRKSDIESQLKFLQLDKEQILADNISTLSINTTHNGEEEEEEEDSDEDDEDTHEDYINIQQIQEEKDDFIDIMVQMFINGLDKDFDYSLIDNNEEYQFSKEYLQDIENEYFEETPKKRPIFNFKEDIEDDDYDYEAEFNEDDNK